MKCPFCFSEYCYYDEISGAFVCFDCKGSIANKKKLERIKEINKRFEEK